MHYSQILFLLFIPDFLNGEMQVVSLMVAECSEGENLYTDIFQNSEILPKNTVTLQCVQEIFLQYTVYIHVHVAVACLIHSL